VNSIIGGIKRAFMLPQNEIIDMQTFAYFFLCCLWHFENGEEPLTGTLSSMAERAAN
jgi:hypothetical protein